MNIPDYRKIYRDMVSMKYPEKEAVCSNILNKKSIERLDIIRLNTMITGEKDIESIRENQKLKSYDRQTILHILDYQRKYGINNTQLAVHFRLSRNTVTKWKKMFL